MITQYFSQVLGTESSWICNGEHKTNIWPLRSQGSVIALGLMHWSKASTWACEGMNSPNLSFGVFVKWQVALTSGHAGTFLNPVAGITALVLSSPRVTATNWAAVVHYFGCQKTTFVGKNALCLSVPLLRNIRAGRRMRLKGVRERLPLRDGLWVRSRRSCSCCCCCRARHASVRWCCRSASGKSRTHFPQSWHGLHGFFIAAMAEKGAAFRREICKMATNTSSCYMCLTSAMWSSQNLKPNAVTVTLLQFCIKQHWDHFLFNSIIGLFSGHSTAPGLNSHISLRLRRCCFTQHRNCRCSHHAGCHYDI